MRRTLVLWLWLFLAACGPPSVAGPGQPPPAGTPIRIVTPTPAFQATPILAQPPTAPPPDYTPPTPQPPTTAYPVPGAPTVVPSPATAPLPEPLPVATAPLPGRPPTAPPPGYIPPSQRPVPTPFMATAYPLPPTPTLAPPARPGRLLFSFPWPNSDPHASPPGIAVGRDGGVFLTDVTRPGLYPYTADGQPLERWDIPPLPNTPPDQRPGAGPRTLAVADDGSLYVPVEDGMRHLGPDGRLLSAWPMSPPLSASSLAVGPDTTVYAINADRSQVTRLTAGGARLGEWKGPRPGEPFRAAPSVAVGPDGTIYVADWGASRIHLFAPDGRFLSAWVGPPEGQVDIYTPVALAVAPDGSVFVLEGRRRRVARFDPAGRLIEWWDGPAEGGQPFSPYALAVADGRVYVVDAANQRVQVYGYTPLGPPVPTLAATPPPPLPSAPPTPTLIPGALGVPEAIMSQSFVSPDHGWILGPVCPQHDCTAAGEGRCKYAVMRSTDGGQSWELAAMQPDWPPHAAARPSYEPVRVTALSRQRALVAFYDDRQRKLPLEATRDGGATWSDLSIPCDGVVDVVMDAVGERQVWALCLTSTGKAPHVGALYESGDGGATWQLRAASVLAGVPPIDNLDVSLSVADDRHAWLGIYERLFRTDDGGVTWQEVTP